MRRRGVVAADVLLGIKLYPVDYVEQATRQINKIDPRSGRMANIIKGRIKTLSIKKAAAEKVGGDTKIYDDQIDEKLKQIMGLADEARRVATHLTEAIGE
jgi:hypothetical protein